MESRDTTALITGSATDIGRSLAVALAREGADLALPDIDEKNALGTGVGQNFPDAASAPNRPQAVLAGCPFRAPAM